MVEFGVQIPMAPFLGRKFSNLTCRFRAPVAACHNLRFTSSPVSDPSVSAGDGTWITREAGDVAERRTEITSASQRVEPHLI